MRLFKILAGAFLAIILFVTPAAAQRCMDHRYAYPGC